MNLFRCLLVTIVIAISLYTVPLVMVGGLDILGQFFGDIARHSWPGQFNLDFFCFLVLAGLWMAWRQRFSVAGCLLGVVAVFGGAPFLCLYLLIESYRVGGDSIALLVGQMRRDQLTEGA